MAQDKQGTKIIIKGPYEWREIILCLSHISMFVHLSVNTSILFFNAYFLPALQRNLYWVGLDINKTVSLNSDSTKL